MVSFFFQAEDGIRDLVRSRGLGDVYKRQDVMGVPAVLIARTDANGAQLLTTDVDPNDVPFILSLIHI